MKKIRRNTFETNSSSTHSVSIPQNVEIKPDYLFVNSEGYTEIELKEFCSYYDHIDQEDRLAFLVQIILYNHFGNLWCVTKDEWEDTVEQLYDYDEFLELSSTIASHTGTKGIRIRKYSEGYIDHESADGYSSVQEFVDYWDTDILSFVFGDKVNLHMEFNG